MELSDIRIEIDKIDDEMLDLFLKRMHLSEDVAKYKSEHSLPIVNIGREREILAKVTERAGDMELYAYQLFNTMFKLSRAHQAELISSSSKISDIIETALANGKEAFPRTGTIACQGVEGANSQAACDKLFPRGNIVYLKTFEAVCNAVESGLCKFGVLPIENSSYGSVRAVYELLRSRNLSIVRSTKLCIRHQLLTKPGVKLSDIKEIYSHEQAIGQCRNYLSSLGNDVKIIPCANTAIAAKMVAASDNNYTAAISSPRCAELYGLSSVGDDIQDNANNYTRFICISKDPAIYAGANKISLVISCSNSPGALYEILSKLSVLGINMNKLESCPVPGTDFEFIFFLDIDASVHEQGIIPLLEDLERTCVNFHFLGNFAEV